MANNEVWVRWKDSSDDWLFDTVTDLKDDAEIKDLRKAFVRQQNLQGQLSPAEVQVRETTVHGEDRLKASSPLVTYFVPPTGCVPEPGKSEDTALFLTVPRIAARGTNAPAIVLQEPLSQQPSRWRKVSGAISRPKTHAGARYELFKLASSLKGLYPPDLDANTAFVTEASDSDPFNRSIIKFSVVFSKVFRAGYFVDNLKAYILRNNGDLQLVDDQQNIVRDLTLSEIDPFPVTVENMVLKTHYEPQNGEAEPGSPLVDMILDTRSSDFTMDVTLLSIKDTTFRFQRIENSASFTLAEAESAHIFPSAKCHGVYEWLDTPDFNRLALSRDVHLNFDGTGRGRGKRRKTVQSFAIRPLRNANTEFSTCIIDECHYYIIPLELVFNRNEIAEAILNKLEKGAALYKYPNDRWTISGADVQIFYPKNNKNTLVTEESEDGDTILVTAIPGVDDLSECWSNSANLYEVEAAEILEKCLLWNYQNALQSWRLVG